MASLKYPVIVSPLSEEDGGGFLATVPDLPGCMSDGETPAEAIENVQDAIEEWLDLARKLGRDIPVASKVTEVACLRPCGPFHFPRCARHCRGGHHDLLLCLRRPVVGVDAFVAACSGVGQPPGGAAAAPRRTRLLAADG